MDPHDIASETGNGGSYGSGSDGSAPSNGSLLASRLRELLLLCLPCRIVRTCTAAQPLPVVTAMAGVIFGGPGIIAGGFATYFLRRATASLPIWQSLGLCGVIYKAGLVILSHTCFFLFFSGRPPSAAVKKRHLFGDSWAAFCAGIACVTTACLTALFTLCALVGLKLWWHWVLLYFGFFCGLPLIGVLFSNCRELIKRFCT